MAIAVGLIEHDRRALTTIGRNPRVEFVVGLPDKANLHLDPHAEKDILTKTLYIELGEDRAEKPQDLSKLPQITIGFGDYRRRVLDLKTILAS
jgi:hypothetical protein